MSENVILQTQWVRIHDRDLQQLIRHIDSEQDKARKSVDHLPEKIKNLGKVFKSSSAGIYVTASIDSALSEELITSIDAAKTSDGIRFSDLSLRMPFDTLSNVAHDLSLSMADIEQRVRRNINPNIPGHGTTPLIVDDGVFSIHYATNKATLEKFGVTPPM